MSIPLSKDFSISSNVIAPAGNAIDANGLMLTNSTAIAPANLNYFYTLRDVGDIFGLLSDEYEAAKIYFNGFDGSAVKPGKLLCIASPSAPTAGTLTTGSNASVSIESLKLLPIGSITISVDGVQQASDNINLSSVVTQSDVADALEAALTGVTVEYSSLSARYVITSNTTGAASSVSFATGAIANALMMTQATGAIVAQGVGDMSLTELMNYVIDRDQNWISFASANELTDIQKIELAQWTNTIESGTRFLYSFNDNSQSITTPNAQNTLLSRMNAENLGAVFGIYGTPRYAFTAPAYIASLDFSALNGRLTYKYRKFSGLATNVDTLSAAKAIESNGYSYYGDYKQTINQYSYAADGAVTGSFKWMDTFVDQVWIRLRLIEAFANTFTANQSLPFNANGYAAVQAPVIDVAQAGLNFGAIQRGVQLDESQRSQIMNRVGRDITPQLYSNGWYFYIPAQPGVNRIERALRSAIFFWCDGQMIQSISMQSTTVL